MLKHGRPTWPQICLWGQKCWRGQLRPVRLPTASTLCKGASTQLSPLGESQESIPTGPAGKEGAHPGRWVSSCLLSALLPLQLTQMPGNWAELARSTMTPHLPTPPWILQFHFIYLILLFWYSAHTFHWSYLLPRAFWCLNSFYFKTTLVLPTLAVFF